MACLQSRSYAVVIPSFHMLLCSRGTPCRGAPGEYKEELSDGIRCHCVVLASMYHHSSCLFRSLFFAALLMDSRLAVQWKDSLQKMKEGMRRNLADERRPGPWSLDVHPDEPIVPEQFEVAAEFDRIMKVSTACLSPISSAWQAASPAGVHNPFFVSCLSRCRAMSGHLR